MRIQYVNRISSVAIVLLSCCALLDVMWGLTQPPIREVDEGTGAHIFQLSIAALLPSTLLFVTTANWTRPWRTVRPLAIAAVATVLAFGALYYLEHLR